MKKQLSLLLLVLTSALLTKSQPGTSQRLVLCETFTGEDCPPSAYLAPHLDSLLNVNPTKVVTIKYFLPYNWGNSGPMPFYYDDQAEVDARNSYYNCFLIPQGYMDGHLSFSGSGSSMALVQSDIDNRYASGSPFEINVNHTISSNLDSVYIRIVVKATDAVNSNFLKARVAVIERVLDFFTPHGTNGETHFENMMKKMLPNANGTSLPILWAAGDSVVLNLNWKFNTHMYDIGQVAIVVFVQNDSTREVLQSGYSAPISIAGISEASNENNLLVYPNPFISEISVSLQKENFMKATVRIYNMTGETVFLKEENNLSSAYSRINMSDIPDGIYFLDVITEGKELVKKIIKQ